MTIKATHYDTLGIEKDADAEAVKKAWRRKASKAHTDRDGGDHSKMVALNRAYEVLSDPEKRARYDQTGNDSNAPSADSQAMDAVMQIFMALLEKTSDYDDLVALAQAHMERQITEFGSKVKQVERQAEILEKKRKRLTYKAKKTGRNFLDDLLAQRGAQLQQAAAGMQEGIAVFRRGVELLQDYAYQADVAPASQSQSGIFTSQLGALYMQVRP